MSIPLALATDGFHGGGGGGAGTAPIITVVSPTPSVDPGETGGLSTSWAVAHVTPIIIDIDGDDLDYASVAARYPTDVGILERVVYRRGAFRSGFTVGSSSEQLTASKLRLTILPDASWPSSLSGAELEIDVDAAGESELSSVASYSFLFPGDPAITPVEVPVEHADIPVIDPVELALSRLPRQYRSDDGIPLELLT